MAGSILKSCDGQIYTLPAVARPVDSHRAMIRFLYGGLIHRRDGLNCRRRLN
jgi:hypothetical protein